MHLDGAAPAVGFTMDIRDEGPARVRVEFRGEEHESKFKAEWEFGELVIDIDEKD